MQVVVVAEQLRRRVPGGIGTYVRGLAQGLAALGADGPEVTYSASRAPKRGPDPAEELGRVATSPLPAPALGWAWDRGLGRPAGPADADVVHATSLAVPPRRRPPLSVMVHDLAWRRFPAAYPRRGRRWHEAALGRALARAGLLLVPSSTTADDLVAAGAPSRRVEVVAEGADHLPPPDHAGAAELLGRAGVAGQFLLTVSTLEPRKNLTRLVEAYDRARPRLPEPWPLVVVGPRGWGPATGGEGASRPDGDVVFAGPVHDRAVLAALYEQARAFAYVPILEGFGLPPVEAMRAGTPVLSSPLPSTGDSALEVDPLDVDAVAQGLSRVAADEDLRAVLIGAGHARAAKLTWAAAARRHVELWQELADAGPRPGPAR